MSRTAPDFTLEDQQGIVRSLSDYAGKWLVVFFYPKDRSLNCTREVCAFRDEYSIIGQFGNAEVVGINSESVASHKDFADKQHITFPLLSDKGSIVTKAYGAWKSNKPKFYDTFFPTRRNTYIVSPQGQIVKEYLTVNPQTHAQIVIQDLQALQQKATSTS